LELEFFLLGGVLAALIIEVPPLDLGRWAITPVWPLLIVYLALLPFTVGRAWMRLSRGEHIDPYDESPEGPPRDLLHLAHQPLPTVILPLYLAGWLAALHWPNLIFVIWLVMRYGLYRLDRWTGAWPLRLICTCWRRRSPRAAERNGTVGEES
jgi:hypothetical protein